MCEVLSRRKNKNSTVIVAKIHATHKSRTESELFFSAKLIFYFQTLTHTVKLKT